MSKRKRDEGEEFNSGDESSYEQRDSVDDCSSSEDENKFYDHDRHSSEESSAQEEEVLQKQKRTRLPKKERLHDGRLYVVNKTKNPSSKYVRCTTINCRASGNLLKSEEQTEWTLKIIHPHEYFCHPSNSLTQDVYFREGIKEILKTGYCALKDAYDTGCQLNPEAGERINYSRIRGGLRYQRQKAFPFNETTVESFARDLDDEKFISLKKGHTAELTTKLIYDVDRNPHMTFYDRYVLECCKDTNVLILDNTFETCPNFTDNYVQLLNVMGVHFGEYVVIYQSFMTSKSENAYDSVLEPLSQLLDVSSVNFTITDYEAALRNSTKKHFTEAQYGGCSVHYERAIYKKISKMKSLAEFLKANEEACRFIYLILCLEFLPPETITDSYYSIKNALDPTVLRNLKTFCSYYEQFWIKSVTPENFSVYGHALRTTNPIEGYHADSKHQLGIHPTPQKFMVKTTILGDRKISKMHRAHNAVENGRPKRTKTIETEKKIYKVWARAKEQGWKIEQLLVCIFNIRFPDHNLNQMIESIASVELPPVDDFVVDAESYVVEELQQAEDYRRDVETVRGNNNNNSNNSKKNDVTINFSRVNKMTLRNSKIIKQKEKLQSPSATITNTSNMKNLRKESVHTKLPVKIVPKIKSIVTVQDKTPHFYKKHETLSQKSKKLQKNEEEINEKQKLLMEQENILKIVETERGNNRNKESTEMDYANDLIDSSTIDNNFAESLEDDGFTNLEELGRNEEASNETMNTEEIPLSPSPSSSQISLFFEDDRVQESLKDGFMNLEDLERSEEASNKTMVTEEIPLSPAASSSHLAHTVVTNDSVALTAGQVVADTLLSNCESIMIQETEASSKKKETVEFRQVLKPETTARKIDSKIKQEYILSLKNRASVDIMETTSFPGFQKLKKSMNKKQRRKFKHLKNQSTPKKIPT